MRNIRQKQQFLSGHKVWITLTQVVKGCVPKVSDFSTLRATISRFLQKKDKEGVELNFASDEKLIQVYLARESTLEEMTSVFKIYKKRHGVPIYLDIAIDITEKVLNQQTASKYKDQQVQEDLLRATIDEILRQVKSKYIVKD